MQRGIDSYFSKKVTVSQPLQPVSSKRKVRTISSDEEDYPNKQATGISNKKPKVSKDPTPSKLKSLPIASQKSRKPVDITSMFAGEATREDKKRSKPIDAATSSDKINSNLIGNSAVSSKTPTKIKRESVEPSRRSPRTPNKSLTILREEVNGAARKTPTKSEIPDLVIKIAKTIKADKKSPLKTDQIEGVEKKPSNLKKLKSIKQEKSSNEDAFESKGKKRTDLETSILSDEERFERKRVAAVLYQKFKNRQSVINPGSKEIPKGKPNCLAGLSFLVTGVLESIERDEANSIIKELGGKVTSTVGKRLNYLIVGEDAGPKKIADAESIGIPILSVDGFFELIRKNSNGQEKTEQDNKFTESKTLHKKITPTKRKQEVEFTTTKMKQEKNEIKAKQEETKTSQIKLEKCEDETVIEIKQELGETVDDSNVAWVDKYKPTSVKQIIGQQGPASNCAKLLNWLTKWHTNQSGSKKLQKPNPWAKSDDGSYFKAALLSGPPGVGKTTTATLVCKELGFDVVEFNASDTRSKRLLKEEVSELLSNKSLYGYFHGNMQIVSKKHVLIMDEVDGMAGNEDRGGIQELIALIKDSHVPVICMCNDRNHQKMRSLVNYCYDLRFIRPRLEQIKGFVRSICFKEKIKLSNEKIDEIILATNNDIRQSVNHICLLSAGNEIELKSNNTKTAQKDMKMGPWEVVRKVFSVDDHKKMSLADKADLFFHDYSMAPLFVQQNYLMVSPSGPKSEVTKKVALTADALSLGDLVDRRIRSNSAWTLLPVQAVLSSVLPGEYMEGHFTGQINFPGWLGKYSKTNKRSRLAQEIHDHTRIRTSGSRLSVRMDYAPYLLSSIVRPLKESGMEGVEKSLNVLQEYRLLREDIDSLIELTTWPGKKSIMEAVDGRVKAALTRAYNKEVLPYSYSAVTAVKKKKIEAAESDDLMDLMENEEGGQAAVDSEEENDTLENDNLIKAKKKATASSSKASTSKASTGKKTSSSVKPKATATARSKK